MNPPKTTEELAMTATTPEKLRQAQDDAFRLARARWTMEEVDKNRKLDDLGIVCAEQMVGIVKSGNSSDADKIGATKAVADVIKSHTTLQTNTFKLHNMDIPVSEKPAEQVRPPPIPVLINAPGAHIHTPPLPSGN